MDSSYFDLVLDRTAESGTYSNKWMAVGERFPGYDPTGVLPMWVADMDLRCPPTVVEAVQKRAEHGIYGYTDGSLVREFIEANADWCERRYGWRPDPDWGVFTPGVLLGVNAAIQEFSDEGDGVIIQSPVYYPFSDGVRNNGRVLKYNMLVEKEPGYYVMDYDNLEELASDPKTKIIIMSNPHNPVGRVWTKEELQKCCEICVRNNVLILADEIHADFIMKGYEFTPIGSLGEDIRNDMIASYAPSKTFNLAGLGASIHYIPNPEIRERFKKRLLANRIPVSNVFGPLAGKVAFQTGDEYVDLLCEYIEGNMDYLKQFCEENCPKIIARKSEGTYMIWVDLRGLGLEDEEGNAFMMTKAKVAGDLGRWFAPGGDGFYRLNLACPRAIVEEAARRIKTAYDEMGF